MSAERYPVKAVKCAPGGNLYEVRLVRQFILPLLAAFLLLSLSLCLSSRVYPLACCSRTRAAPKPFCCVMFVRVAAAACLMHATHAVVFIDTQAPSLSLSLSLLLLPLSAALPSLCTFPSLSFVLSLLLPCSVSGSTFRSDSI